MSGRSAAAKKAWVTRRAGAGAKKAVAKRLSEYMSFREHSGNYSYSTRRQPGESRHAQIKRLGVGNVKPLRGGLIITRRPASVPGLSPSAKAWIDGLGFPLGKSRGRR